MYNSLVWALLFGYLGPASLGCLAIAFLDCVLSAKLLGKPLKKVNMESIEAFGKSQTRSLLELSIIKRATGLKSLPPFFSTYWFRWTINVRGVCVLGSFGRRRRHWFVGTGWLDEFIQWIRVAMALLAIFRSSLFWAENVGGKYS